MPEKLKVLVVDDDKEFCQNVRDILVELKNYQVMEHAYWWWMMIRISVLT